MQFYVEKENRNTKNIRQEKKKKKKRRKKPSLNKHLKSFTQVLLFFSSILHSTSWPYNEAKNTKILSHALPVLLQSLKCMRYIYPQTKKPQFAVSFSSAAHYQIPSPLLLLLFLLLLVQQAVLSHCGNFRTVWWSWWRRGRNGIVWMQ